MLFAVGTGGAAEPASPRELRVAVASNFATACAAVGRQFETRTGVRPVASTGSTGQLDAQIRNGAPFAVFLAADTLHPAALERDGFAVRGSRATYAVGGLVLWSADAGRIGADSSAALRGRDVRHVAIANPRTAPYGQAAAQVLHALGLWEVVQPRLVQGENIAQTAQFVESGNAELGFVARAQLAGPPLAGRGSRWDVPAAFHDPIRQDAVLLAVASTDSAASAFLAYLQGPEAFAVIERFGYRRP